MKTVAIIGSTGSIGTQALDVLRDLDHEFQVVALAANTSVDKLYAQIGEFQPRLVAVQDPKAREELEARLTGSIAQVVGGDKPLETLVLEADADITIVSVVGAAGLLPALAAARLGKRLALANKESLVLGGELLLAECSQHGTELIPIDSEHSAIFQCLLGQDIDAVGKIVLTASGGPFLHVPAEKMRVAALEDALAHPTWDMGGKITIDSATMMNKGLEVIEAHYLFGIDYDRIDVLVHPQSIIHSYVEYNDGAIIAQLGIADMRVPIQLALTYPQRKPRSERLNLVGKTLEFFAPDLEKFGCLRLAYEAGRAGGDRPVVLNAANEVAVEHFLIRKITFGGIYEVVLETLERFPTRSASTLSELLEVDKLVREFAVGLIETGRWRT